MWNILIVNYITNSCIWINCVTSQAIYYKLPKYEGNSRSKLQIVIAKNWMEIMTYKKHLIFNTISTQI
jgi:hypothetical protein